MSEHEESLGEPIVCADYDLEAALRQENAARMAREDAGLASDEDEDDEVEEATQENARYAHNTPVATPAPSLPLTGDQKKKDQNRRRQRAKRKAAVVAALSSTTPPPPPPRNLEKAAASVPIKVAFAADDFRATKQRWTGLAKPVDHPLLAHANEPEVLKQHMQYVDWQGEKCHVIIDRGGHVIGVLVCPPAPGETWDAVVQAATAAMRAARDKMLFPPSACSHRRGNFPAPADGFGFGGGRKTVGNIKASSQTNRAAMDELLEDQSIQRMATYPIPVFQAKNPHLRRIFARSPFAAVTANLGPVSVSPPHTDAGNKADGMCLIGALGNFDADKGGHLVCWDYNLIVRFPADGEDRFSLIQYSAGGLFRWIANGFRSDLAWAASASAAGLARREEDRKSRWRTALKKFALWKDVKVKNFSGRGRVEVWDEGDVADFSDLTEDETEAPKKRTRRL
ncbi:hypothetical protein B0H14DRAFT_3495283 [Mycena olivaceomarginata]|nr:hypothetical protein B0H14DRAFT_3495283 [Mycena olivaceomarginata]